MESIIKKTSKLRKKEQQAQTGQNQTQSQSSTGSPINPDPRNSTQNPSNFGPWEMRDAALSVIDNNSECSDWLNSGGGNAHQIMSTVPILLDRDPATVHNHDDASTTPDPKTPIFVNAQGHFYANSVNQEPLAGRYLPGTYGARMTILLHEIAHKLNIPGFANDGMLHQGQSEINTQLLLQHCFF